MSFRSLASLRVAASFAVVLVLSACSDDRVAQLSGVETVEVPTADAGPQANQNIANPTLQIPMTYPVEEGDELTLVWSEEFDGPEIDPEVWFFESADGCQYGPDLCGWGNNELQYYLPDNAMIVNGALEITARRESVGGLNYTSARINTQDRFAFKYGRIEASIKLPSGQGLWPAFWMLPQDDDYLCSGEPCLWAAFGEIDIVEAVNLGGTGSNEIFSTIHYGGELPANQSTETRYTPSVDVTEDFHTYALEWDEDEIRWYFDGELFAVANSWFTDADGQEYPAPFNRPFHILLNMAVGGNFPGSPNGTTPWPVTMEVDWVRIYSGEPPPADAGDVPANAVFVTDPSVTADLAAPILDNFGSGATFNTFFAGDADFKPTLQVTSGEGYGAGVHVGFVAFAGYEAGFAADYETLSFKVKGLPGDELEIKFFGSPENSIIINLGTYAGATDLGNGWYQVTVPLSDFAANIYAFTGFLIGPPGDQGAAFSFLLTDIGFDGAIVTTPADAGTTPDVTLYARGAATDLVFGEDYTEVAVFGSGAIANNNNTGDVDFSPAFSVSTGFGYEKWNAQLAFLGFAAGFASSYETLDFKVKGMAGDTIRVKLLNDPNPDYVDVVLTSSSYATSLGNGWYQVAVPIADFPGDVATASGLLFETIDPAPDAAFTFLLNDIGFSGTVDTGGGDGLVGDVDGDGYVYLFATDTGTTVDLVADTDFSIVDWDSGSTITTDFATDPDFNPVIQVVNGSGWGAPTAAIAFTGITAGFAENYVDLNFKIKDLPTGSVWVKFATGGDPQLEIEFDLATYATDIPGTTGWKQVTIPLSSFPDLGTYTEFAIHSGWSNGGTFLLTDVAFTGALPGDGLAGDVDGDGYVYLFATDTGTTVDLVADTDFSIVDWDSGSTITTDFATDPDFNPVIQVVNGSGWGAPTAAIAFTGITAGFAENYVDLNFKIKDLPTGSVWVKFATGGDPQLEIEFDLATYATDIPGTTGWKQVTIPLSSFPDLGTYTEFAIHSGWSNGGTFLLTDVAFTGALPGDGLAGDVDGDGYVYLFATDSGTTVDLVADTDFSIVDWDSGSTITTDFATDPDFNPVIQVVNGSGWGAPTAAIAFTGITVGFAENYVDLNFKIKDLPTGSVWVKFATGGDPQLEIEFDLATYATDIPGTTGWKQVTIPLSSFPDLGTYTEFAIHSGWSNGGTFLLTDVAFTGAGSDGGGGDGGPELLSNGDFEAGDTSGWESGGTGSFNATMDQATGPGEWSGNLAAAGAGSNILIKQANLAVGTVAPNQAINVSFDYCGSNTGIGGVVKLELLSEFGGGAGASRDELGQLTLTDTWQAVTYNRVTGDDVDGGVTLQIIADCGGNADCAIDAFLDNVSVTLDDDVGNVSGAGGACSGGDGGGGDGLAGDVDGDGYVYLYATDSGTTVDLVADTDFSIVDWDSGSTITTDFATDPDFNPVIQVVNGSGWGAPTAAIAFTGITAGFAENYVDLNFKIKDLPTGSVWVKFATGGDPQLEIEFDLATYATDIPGTTGWKQVTIPLSSFPDLGTYTEFAIHSGWSNGGTFLLTDVAFTGALPGDGLAGDVDGDGYVYLYATDSGTTVDLVADTDFSIVDWDSGSTITTDFATDPDFNPVIQVVNGSGWGAPTAAIAFTGITAGFAENYVDLNFKIKDLPTGSVWVKFATGGDPQLEIEFDLATYATDIPGTTGWKQVTIPLSSFPDLGTYTEFAIHSGWSNGGTFLLTDVAFTGAGSGGGGGVAGNIVPDGDFENGTLVDPPWKTFANNGVVEISDAQANGGTFSAHLLASGAGSFPTLKVERLEEGNLTGGESVTVSFDAIAVSQLPGAVVFFAELLTERAGDNGASNEFLIAPPVFLTDSWTSYSFDTTLGPDAGGGVSLQFKADCGGDAACVLDAYIDNVSIVIN